MADLLDLSDDENVQVRTLRAHSAILQQRIDAQSTQLDGMELRFRGMREEKSAIQQELDLYSRALERVLAVSAKLKQDKEDLQEKLVARDARIKELEAKLLAQGIA